MLDKEIQEAQKQLKIYQEAIVKERAELAKIRTDKSEAAKTTLSSLQSEIPVLEEVIAKKKSEILSIDKIIEDKKAIANIRQTDFDKLESNLREEYEIHRVALEKREVEQNKRDDDFKIKASEFGNDLVSREKELDFGWRDFRAEQDGFNTVKKDFRDQQDLFFAEVHKHQEEHEKQLAYIKEQKELIVDRQKELSDREHDIFEREKKASEVIAREATLDDRKKQLDYREQLMDERVAGINTENARVRAEIVRMNKRDGEQNSREEKLKQREDNLKVLEAKV